MSNPEHNTDFNENRINPDSANPKCPSVLGKSLMSGYDLLKAFTVINHIFVKN